MTLYEVLEDCRGCATLDTSYGLFSTYENASNLIKMFEGCDGFGICEEDLYIREVTIIPDKIEDWVLELIEGCKRRKKKYEDE